MVNLQNPELPKDFDWKFYLDNHPDLGLAGINTEKCAIAHYMLFGYNEQRRYKSTAQSIGEAYTTENSYHLSPDTKICLFSQWYHDADTERHRKKCLLNNLKNQYIDNIHIFYEKDSIKQIPDITKKTKVSSSPIGKRLSYSDWILYSQNNFTNHIKVLANSDIYFDKTIQYIKKQKFSPYNFYAITRKDLSEKGEIVESSDYYGDDSCLSNPLYSHDAWIFYNTLLISPDSIKECFDFDLGKGNCDRLFSNYLNQQKIYLKNLYPDINAIHIDYRKNKTRKHYDLNKEKRTEVIGNISQYFTQDDLEAYQNKLECLTLLITSNEDKDGQYDTFIENLRKSMTRANKKIAKKLSFRIIRNNNENDNIDLSYLKKTFRDVDIIYLNIPEEYNHYNSEDETLDFTYGKQSGPLYSFFSIFRQRHLENFNTSLFLECDCILLDNWLDKIYNYCLTSGPFMISGSQYDGHCYMKYYDINNQHINGGICLYSTGNQILNQYMDFCLDSVPLYVRRISQNMPYDYTIYYVLENNYDYNLSNREILKFIKKNILKNNLICNYCNNIPQDIDFPVSEIIKRYQPAIIHQKIKINEPK